MVRRWTSHLLLFCSALAIATASFYTDRAVAQPASGEAQVITPGSSVPKPEDAGIRAHTNVKLLVPEGGPGSVAPPSPANAAGPAELPPVSGLIMRTHPLRLLVCTGWYRDRVMAAIPMS
jgi:hypothetical protein